MDIKTQAHGTFDNLSESKQRAHPSEKNTVQSTLPVVVSQDDSASSDSIILEAEHRAQAERRLVRKLDMRLMPMIVLLFVINYIDRTNVSAARLKGLEQDLNLTDLQYITVVTIIYASYCPAQIPSNMALNWITRPSIYIGACVVLWGLTSAMTGLTQNFAGIVACRISIGLPESAFYPGAVYLLSRWYTRKELAFRSALLYGGLLLANAFGSLMAAGILSNMEGKRGIRAWRWLFFIEGAISIVIGFLAMWALPDYPENTRWITQSERRLAQVRLAEDAGEADKDGANDSMWAGLKMAVTDMKVVLFSLMCIGELLGSSFINFFPTLTATLGFDTTISLLLAAPPWICAAILCCLNAFHADKSGERFFHLSVPMWGAILGYIIAMSTLSTGARYVSMFMMASGFAGFSLTLVWVSNAVPRPPAKRAAAIAVVNAIGNLGNLVGSYAWKVEWGPQYHQSMGIGIAALASASVFALVIRQTLARENQQLDADEQGALKGANRERVELAAQLEGISIEEALERKRGFRNLY